MSFINGFDGDLYCTVTLVLRLEHSSERTLAEQLFGVDVVKVLHLRRLRFAHDEFRLTRVFGRETVTHAF